MYGATQKFRLDVWSMFNFTYPRKLTYKLLTHMMKIRSLIKDSVLAPNALQQVTVGSSFDLFAHPEGHKFAAKLLFT